MAAFITFKSGMSFEFHIGTRLTQRFIQPLDWQDVISIQADGHELEQCCNILGVNVPYRVFTFIYRDAQQIAVNWR